MFMLMIDVNVVQLPRGVTSMGGGEGVIWKHIENFCNSALFKASSYLYHFHNVSPYLPHFPYVACGESR